MEEQVCYETDSGFAKVSLSGAINLEQKYFAVTYNTQLNKNSVIQSLTEIDSEYEPIVASSYERILKTMKPIKIGKYKQIVVVRMNADQNLEKIISIIDFSDEDCK